MQYRYHEWTDKILSKRTAESIGSSTLIGLKCGFDVVTITRPSGSNPAKVVIGHLASPSNSIADRLHLTPEQQNTLTAIGCVITPDCVITTEDTPIEFQIPFAEWNSRSDHAWAVVATHNYIEIPESSTTLQGGSPTIYKLVNLMGVITSMGLQQFMDGYLLTDNSGKLIDLIYSLDESLAPYNTVVLGVITGVQAVNPTTSKYTPIYNNTTPILKRFTEYEYNDILESINGVITAMTSLREDLETQMSELEERVNQELANTIAAINTALTTMQNSILTTLRNEISLVDIKLVNPLMDVTSTMPNEDNKILIKKTLAAWIPNPNHPSLNGMGLELPSYTDTNNVKYASNIKGGLAFEKTSGGSEFVTGNLYTFVPFTRINYWRKVNAGAIPTTTYTFECYYDSSIVNPIVSSGYINCWANLIFTLHSQQL